MASEYPKMIDITSLDIITPTPRQYDAWQMRKDVLSDWVVASHWVVNHCSGVLICPLITGTSTSSRNRNDGAKEGQASSRKIGTEPIEMCTSSNLGWDNQWANHLEKPPNRPIAIYRNKQTEMIGYSRCNYSPMGYLLWDGSTLLFHLILSVALSISLHFIFGLIGSYLIWGLYFILEEHFPSYRYLALWILL